MIKASEYKRILPLGSLLALAISTVVVHFIYLEIIWPQAETDLALAQEAGQSTVRTLAVILKDIEQEICIILMLWGMYLIAEKSLSIIRHRYLFRVDFLNTHSGGESLDVQQDINQEMEKSFHTLKQLPEKIQSTPLIQTLSSSIRRFIITRSVHNTSEAIITGVEALAHQMESENAMIRYLIWAIPSIGFIGTVRGIGEALTHADEALSGDIANIASSLGVAFNSTFVALIISIFLMFFLHQLQRIQDSQITEIRSYCEQFLLNRIGKVDAKE
ncbi:MAG: MotA/TolQ/ExbB proton channel family protein [Gammaproteobacteria bacterium]|nr:MotA/TolQ/ExbB proton channel family protein [Gammaproteobacteria bacterium]